MKKYLVLLFLISFICWISCANNDSQNQANTLQADTTKPEPIEDPFPVIKYELRTLKSLGEILTLVRKYKDSTEREQYKKLLATLSRKEFRFFGAGSKVVIPDTFVKDLIAYSVFPQFYTGAKSLKKLIVVDNHMQAYACYEYGKLIRFAAANTGKERTPTFPGRYSLNWKKRVHKSSLDSAWEMPFTWNFHSEAGNAFHQFVMPGRPVSHSCIRQFLDDAEWLFKWGEGFKFDSLKKVIPYSGTPVLILNHFDFSRKHGGPWQDISSNKDGIVVLPPDPMQVEEALIPIVQIPESARGALRNKQRFVAAEDTLRARGIIRPHVKLTPSVDFNKKKRIKAAREHKKKMEAMQQNNNNTKTN